jgi:hypothetical protein
MAIKVFCEGCNKTYNVRDDMAGKRGKCPAGHTIAVPVAVEASPQSSIRNAAASASSEHRSPKQRVAAVAPTVPSNSSGSRLPWVIGGGVLGTLLLATVAWVVLGNFPRDSESPPVDQIKNVARESAPQAPSGQNEPAPIAQATVTTPTKQQATSESARQSMTKAELDSTSRNQDAGAVADNQSVWESPNWRLVLDKVEYLKISTRTGMFNRSYFVIDASGPEPTDHVGIWLTATAKAVNKNHGKYTEAIVGADPLKVYVFNFNERDQEFVADSLEGVKGVIPFEVAIGEARKHAVVLALSEQQADAWPGQTHTVVLKKFYDFPELKLDLKLPQ